MSHIIFDDFCREVLECEHYIEWEYEYELRDGNSRYESVMTCVSCQKVGQSMNIDTYPADCPHKESLAVYAIELEEKHQEFLKKCEQEKIWKKLNDETI